MCFCPSNTITYLSKRKEEGEKWKREEGCVVGEVFDSHQLLVQSPEVKWNL